MSLQNFRLATPILPTICLFVAALVGCSSDPAASGNNPGNPGNPGVSLVRVEIAPSNASIATGTDVAFSALAIFSDNSTQNVTDQTIWNSSQSSIASISNTAGSRGLASGLNAGSTTISAVFNGIIASTSLTVSAATINQIQVTPANPSNAVGTQRQFVATAIFSDNSNQNITSSATWSSSNSAVATISNATGSRGLATANAEGSSTISATFMGVTGGTTMNVTAATVNAVQITPSNTTIANGSSQQYTATAIFSDSSTQDVTDSTNWSSSQTAVASISNLAANRGLASALGLGTTTISGQFLGVTGTTNLTVSAATVSSLEIQPINPSIGRGTNLQFSATAILTDNSTQNVTNDPSLVWSSSDISVATISNATMTKGLASSLAQGTTTIAATFAGATAQTMLTVTPAVLSSVEVTPSSPQVPRGTTQQFVATAVFSDSSTQDVTANATWSSSASAIAAISNADGSRGLAAANAEGMTTISAAFSSVTGSTTMTVTPASVTAINVTPSNPSLPLGFNQAFTATGSLSDGGTRDVTNSVTWISTAPNIATISNAADSRGLASSVSVGSTTIIARLGQIQGTTALTVSSATLNAIGVTPNPVSVADGFSRPFTATGSFSDASNRDITNQVTWSSSDPSVASISNSAGSRGVALALDPGSSTITAVRSSVMGSAALTVTPAVISMVEVSPANPTVSAGRDIQLVATGTFSDGDTADITEQATWSSTATNVATVSNASGSRGLTSGVAVGSAMIRAALGGQTGTANLMVTPAVLESIDVTPASPSIALGLNQQFTATGNFSDGTTQNLTSTVTWTSSDPAVATISNAMGSQGLASSMSQGMTDISASLDSFTGVQTLTITPVALTQINISPLNASLPRGTSRQYSANGIFSDGSQQDITTSVTWSSSDTTRFDISNANGSEGLGVAINVGTATVSAAFPGAPTASTNVTVGDAALQAIRLTPSNISLPVGFERQYTAIGDFSDGSSQDLSNQVTWSSFAPAVASVSNAAGSRGLVNAVSPGTTNILATRQGITGQTQITVTNATLTSIGVTPNNASVGPGDSIQFTATGNFSDSSSMTITTQVTWASSNTSAATISNAPGSQGRATAGNLPGSSTISATRGAVSGTATLSRTLF